MKFGGKIERKSADTLRVSSENKNGFVEYVDGTFFHEKKEDHWPLPQFISITVYSSISKNIQRVTRGLCASKKQKLLRGTGVFQSPAYYPVIPAEKLDNSESKRRNAIESCKNARVPKRLFDSCVTDVIQRGNSIHFKKRPKTTKNPQLPQLGPRF